MVPIRPHRTPPAEHAVASSGHADRKPLDAPRERSWIVGLHEEMHVVALD